jgi:hypothetical protein
MSIIDSGGNVVIYHLHQLGKGEIIFPFLTAIRSEVDERKSQVGVI